MQRESGWDHARVVHYQQVAWAQHQVQIADMQVQRRGCSLIDKQLGAVARLNGGLRYALYWELVVEISQTHDR
jgi:hypothetical protein